jgi:hypothetical protein
MLAKASPMVQSRRARQRIAFQRRRQTFCGGLQQVTGAHVGGIGDARIGGAEQLDQEVGGFLRHARFAGGDIALAGDTLGLPGHGAGEADQQDQQQRGDRGADRMPAQEGVQAVGGGIRPCLHRTAIEPAVEVLGQLRGGPVTALGCLVHGLHHDGVEVTRFGAALSRSL